jgi:hypothetical protein
VDSATEAIGGGQNISVIWLLATKEMAGRNLPPALLTRVPDFPDVAAKRLSIGRSELTNDRPGKVTFSVAIAAPDAARLSVLTQTFLKADASDHRALRLQRTFVTNRVAVFCNPENAALLKDWGALSDTGVWNEVQIHRLAERETMTDEQLEECQEAYFIDRSRGDRLPAAAQALLDPSPLGATTLRVARGTTADGRPQTVISAPTALLLKHRAAQFPHVATIPPSATEEVVDLRGIGTTSLLVLGAEPSADEREQLATLLGNDLRQRLNLTLQEGGATLRALLGVVSVEQILGDAATSRKLRSSGQLNHVWVFTITDYSGDTRYDTSVRKTTPDVAPFTEPEPIRPRQRNKESDGDFRKRLDAWRSDDDDWRRRRDRQTDLYESGPVDWERVATQFESARCRGTLKLVRLIGAPVAVWEKAFEGTVEARKVVKTDSVRVRGHRLRPQALDIPGSRGDCSPSLLREAVLKGGRSALEAVEAQTLLPGPGVAATDATDGGPDRPLGKIAQVDSATGQVTINAGSERGVRTGMLLVVPVKVQTVTDPDTGQILKSRVIETVTLKVTEVDALSAECVAATPNDAKRLSQLKVGMVVQRAPTRE